MTKIKVKQIYSACDRCNEIIALVKGNWQDASDRRRCFYSKQHDQHVSHVPTKRWSVS